MQAQIVASADGDAALGLVVVALLALNLHMFAPSFKHEVRLIRLHCLVHSPRPMKLFGIIHGARVC